MGRKDLSRERGYITEDPIIEVSDESKFQCAMLVQMINKDKIKVEIFPGKTSDQVSAFTQNARIYTR